MLLPLLLLLLLLPCGTNPCFSGDTLVRVLGLADPVPMRELRTGQHIQCLTTSDDLRVPLAASWCELVNWLHAEDAPLVQARINFTHPGGAPGSIVVAPPHFIMKLIGAGVAAGSTAPSADGFGEFTTVSAIDIKVGDLLPVLANQADPSAGFVAVPVTAADTVVANGMFLPALRSPYIVAEGIVAPLWINSKTKVVVPSGMDGEGAKQATNQYQYATLWMTRLQPNGTAGSAGSWDGNPDWPGVAAIFAAKDPHRQAGESLNFTALRDWFMPRYAAWQADPAAYITLDEAVAIMGSDSVWIKPAGGREEPSAGEPDKEALRWGPL